MRLIRNAKEYKSPEDRKTFTKLLKAFIVELFFNNLFEKMLTKDSVWESVVEDKKSGASEAVVGLISEVINILNLVFQKVVKS